MQALQHSRLAHPKRGRSAKKSSNDHKDDIFVPPTGQSPSCAPLQSLLEARGLGNPTPALALRLDVAGGFFRGPPWRGVAPPAPRPHAPAFRPPLPPPAPPPVRVIHPRFRPRPP